MCRKAESNDKDNNWSTYFFTQTCPPIAFCSGSVGVNAGARRIYSLRHTDVVFTMFWSSSSNLCGDLLILSPRATVIGDLLQIVTYFNSSSSKWLPRLQNILCAI